MKILLASDRAVLVRLDGHPRVVSLARALERERPAGVTSFSPAYSSVLVRYDPSIVEAASLQDWLASAERSGDRSPDARLVVLPAIFDGADLDELARAKSLRTDDVVEIFCSTAYRVYFFGFVPGFAYMGEVDERIAMPRRAVPRKSVPAGSVGIAGRQTGVYPVETPGGWNLIGKCTLTIFDPDREPACLLQAGDTVRFEPA